MRRPVLLVVIAVALATGSAQAADDAAKTKALDRFLVAMNAERAWQSIGRSALYAYLPLVAMNADRQQDAARIIEADVVPEIRALRPTFMNALRRAYGKRFTTAELNQVSAFLESPVGRKLRRSEAEVPAEATMALKPFQDKLLKTITPRVIGKLKAAGLRTPAPVPPAKK